MLMHALHTVHAVPDLRVVAGRLRDGGSPDSIAQARQLTIQLAQAARESNQRRQRPSSCPTTILGFIGAGTFAESFSFS
jgi:hypothetical protein